MAILRKTKTFEELKKKVKEQSTGTSFVNKDEVKWEPNNTYRFRLLMRDEDEDSKWTWHDDLNTSDGFIKKIFHGAKDKSGKYIQVICPVTFYGKQGYSMCPTCSSLPDMWDGKKCINPIYNDVKRKDGIYAYVYVIKDPVTPSNEGHIKCIWMPKKMYTDLKLQIWGIDERYAREGEELEEVDISDSYEEEAFLMDNGFDLIVKIIKDKIKDPRTGKQREINVYNCTFAKDRSDLDIEDYELLDKEMEEMELGKDFIPEDPEVLEDFYNRCVLGNNKPSAKAKPASKEDEEVEDSTDDDSVDDDMDDIVDEIEEMEEETEEKVEEKPKTKTKAKTKAKTKTKAKAKKKVEEKVEDPDEIDMGDTEEPVDDSEDEEPVDDSEDEEVDDMEDIDDIDIDEIMADMDIDMDEE